jgi:hypothetical protein
MYLGTKDDNYPGLAYIVNPDHPDYTREFKYTFKLPDGITGDMVLLWCNWINANTCLPPGYDKYAFPPNLSPHNAISPGMCSPNNLGEQFGTVQKWNSL